MSAEVSFLRELVNSEGGLLRQIVLLGILYFLLQNQISDLDGKLDKKIDTIDTDLSAQIAEVDKKFDTKFDDLKQGKSLHETANRFRQYVSDEHC